MEHQKIDPQKIRHVHDHLRYLQVDGEPVLLPEKAYKNTSWLNSSGAKSIRILSEFMEPAQRFEACGVRHAILFFGSARARSHDEHARAVARTEALIADPETKPEERTRQQQALLRLEKGRWMCDVYDKIELLARKLTEWSVSRRGPDGRMPYIVSTGGGPGLMEAANKGAASVPGALTAGIAISLPFEAGLNKFCSPELSFQHHYFFSRKYALCWPSRALVACPGGFGTFDELFEVLTLLQSGKISLGDTLPIVLFGESFWRKVVDFDELVDRGVISPGDKTRLFFTDDVDDAFRHITSKLLEWEAAQAAAEVAAAREAAVRAHKAFAAAHALAVRAASDAEECGASPGVIVQSARNLLPQAEAEAYCGGGAADTSAWTPSFTPPGLSLPSLVAPESPYDASLAVAAGSGSGAPLEQPAVSSAALRVRAPRE